MLKETDLTRFRHFFPVHPHPFLSEPFVELNQAKAERIIRLISDDTKPSLGFIAGIRNKRIISPFSAPFGGFHFKSENVYPSEIENFLHELKQFITDQGFDGLDITLPPGLYHPTFNSKLINVMIRSGFEMPVPEITSWIDLKKYPGDFTQRNSREYYRQALRNALVFKKVDSEKEQKEVYELIRKNRERFGRPIFMSFGDVLNTIKLWPSDFFKVSALDDQILASAIIYRYHPDICYALFWGDNEPGRPLRAMDFLAWNLWSYYKNLGFSYLDLGISTESGLPNEGLLRFKESHDATSGLRFTFRYNRF